MYKVRLSFFKKDYAKFVSHLDLMKMFQRVFRIAGVDVTFSQGFNPHPKMSIAYPLPVGVTSGEEYLDLQVDSAPDYVDLVNKINSAMPKDIKITKAWEPRDNMNEICLAEYTTILTLYNEISELESVIETFMAFCGENLPENAFMITREETYLNKGTLDDPAFAPLDSIGSILV